MSDVSNPIPFIGRIEPLAAGYDLMLCDVWGVLHNGRDVFDGAVEACGRFRTNGGTVILISNSPRPCAHLVRQLDRLGVAREAYDGAVTSGDVTHARLKERAGLRVLHLGPERDKGIFEGLDIAFATAQEAEIVVCSGLYDDTSETPGDYADLLNQLKRLDLTMICANPDLMVERGAVLVYCAGALAQAYEEIGGEVVYAGKPYRPIYDIALARGADLRGAEIERARVLAVGDSLNTDIAGAAGAGIDAIYVASGLHLQAGPDGFDANAVAELFCGQEIKPVATMAQLNW